MNHRVSGLLLFALLLGACGHATESEGQSDSTQAKAPLTKTRVLQPKPVPFKTVLKTQASKVPPAPKDPNRSLNVKKGTSSKKTSARKRDNGDSKTTQKRVRPTESIGQTCRGDFSQVFRTVSPSVVGVAAGLLVDERFKITRRGTGFAWDNQGHIVTNAHTVAEATEVRVRTQAGKVVRAHVVGLDANTDLAVLAVEQLKLVPIKRGHYSTVAPGQWVAAIGNPYGMDHSITVGVVSAIGRKNLPPGAPKYADFIQSDVSIFPGNSGGPLVNDRSEVIGLNTAKLGQGLSFSTRIDMVETVTVRLLREGRFDRGFAGLFVRHVSAKNAERCGLSKATGARVRAVVQDGPADLAGLIPGDVILQYDSRKIDGPAALPWMIAATQPGDTVLLKVARLKSRLFLEMTVDDAP